MPPNPRVVKAFRAMKDIGISEEKVKPVLKSLIKLYDKNWELIEEENYRALADAIFEKEEAEAAERKKSENIVQEEVLEEEAVHEEPERPLKRLRLKHQGQGQGQASPSAANSSSVLAETSFKRPKVEEEAELPGTHSQVHSQGITVSPGLNNGSAAAASQSVPCLTYNRNKGKQPVSSKAMLPENSAPSQSAGPERNQPKSSNSNSHLNHLREKETQTPQLMSGEKSSVPEKSFHASNLKEPKTEPGIELSPKQKILGTHALVRPKDEPYTLDMPHFEVPIAVIHSEPSNKKGSSSGNVPRRQPETLLEAEPRDVIEDGGNIPALSNGIPTSHELVTVQDDCYSNLDIASSPFGEVKISIDCDSALGRSNFHLPSLEAVLKLVEDKCLKSYKIPDPNFSLMKLMKDTCECFLELGTQYNHEAQEITDVVAENDTGYRSMAHDSSNGSMNFELDAGDAQRDILQLPPCNGHDDNHQADQIASMVNCDIGPETDQNSLEQTTSHSPVAPCESAPGVIGPETDQNSLEQTTSQISVALCESAPDEIGPETDQNSLEQTTSQSPVALGESAPDETGPETDQNSIEQTTSQSAVALRESAPDELGPFDVTDITKGQEKVMISLVNEVNNKCPPSFQYIPQNVVFQNAYVNFSLARIGDDNSCSTCSGDCLSLSTPCACAHETGGEFAYTKEGLVEEGFLKECISMNRDPDKHCQFFCKECPLERSKNEDIIEPCKGHLVRNFIKECWWKCGCNKQCGNRVVQRGISRKLQVFMTPEGKGWGLRTLEDLPKGAFVCEYVGEVLTNAELFDRISQSPNSEEHSYPVLLDADWGSEGVLKDEEALCLDATFYGNVARFINHRCFDSTMVEIPVEIETPDHHYYHLAFFTTRKVKAMEELTWDYGIDFDDLEHPVKAFGCQCGSKFCRNIKRSSRSRSRR